MLELLFFFFVTFLWYNPVAFFHLAYADVRQLALVVVVTLWVWAV